VTIRRETTRLSVCSALFKQRTGGLVVRWVISSEYLLLYVFAYFSFAPDDGYRAMPVVCSVSNGPI
jgi:hypothetical protein